MSDHSVRAVSFVAVRVGATVVIVFFVIDSMSGLVIAKLCVGAAVISFLVELLLFVKVVEAASAKNSEDKDDEDVGHNDIPEPV